MKDNVKRVFLNSIITLLICFVFLFIFQTHQDYSYYSKYNKDELVKFFSMKDTLYFNLKQALYWSVRQIIIFVPIFVILEKFKIKNIFKIILTLGLTFVITFIYIVSNLVITF